MLLNDLIMKNPLGFLQTENKDMLAPGEMGAVLARAGVGKTALIVQLALNSLIQQKNVLHISLNDPVKKVTLWYEEMLRHLTADCDAAQTKQIWEAALPHRFRRQTNFTGHANSPLLAKRNGRVSVSFGKQVPPTQDDTIWDMQNISHVTCYCVTDFTNGTFFLNILTVAWLF